jgi:hypothetical protein
MYLAGYLLAEYREAEGREAEGYHARYSGVAGFQRFCGYAESPKDKLLETLPAECRPFVTWSAEP